MKRRRQFSELWFRVRNGHWCGHMIPTLDGRGYSTWVPWRIVDGMRKWRWCTKCGRSEWA